MSFAAEVYQFTSRHKKYWLILMIAMMLLFGGLTVFSYSLGAGDRAGSLDLISARSAPV